VISGWRNAVVLRQVVMRLLGPGARITIDLRDVEVVEAAGLGALVGSCRRVRAGGDSATVTNANARVECVLTSAGLGRLLGERPQIATKAALHATATTTGCWSR
jgi:anti-anti-sigma factor